MATSKGANTYNRLNWEDSEFPILCQTCLGDNPYIRMTKEKFGKECKICSRPFTVFRWCPGSRMRFKKTEVCQTCSKQKNVCQTCLLDLEYGLPVQVRDYAMNLKDEIPRSEVNREYYSQNMEREVANTDGTVAFGALGKTQNPSDLLMKLARTTPYYKRNRPHICSFWVKGECKRGEECPYRHEKPTDPDDPLADQNIKDRYYGANDPVADKLLRRAAAMPKLEPPEDKTITTLYVGNLGEKITEKELNFCSQIVSGLRHCHQHLIVHGDVKPAKVIVSPLGICKLGDFGHIIDLRKLDETKSIHPPVDIGGTTAYAAPEVLRGSCPTPSSDMYSFGILLWQVETREIPFAGEHPHVIIYKVEEGGLSYLFFYCQNVVFTEFS